MEFVQFCCCSDISFFIDVIFTGLLSNPCVNVASEMKKLAIIAFSHPESTLPLCKYLSKEGYFVDYYFITYIGQNNAAAFEFGCRAAYPAISRLKDRQIPSLLHYFNSDRINVFLVVIPPPFKSLGKYVSRILQFFQCFFFFIFSLYLRIKNYYCIDIVGQKAELVYLHKYLKGVRKIHSLHEVLNHLTGDLKHDDILVNYLIEKNVDIIVHSKNTYNDLLKYQFACEKNISVIPFGLFETYLLFDEEAKKLVLDIDSGYILFFGWIEPYKGLSLLYEAMKIVESEYPSVKIVVAGRGYDESLEKMLKSDKYIVINRFITNAEMVFLNKNAKIVVCPYLSASQSGIVQTSFLFGKPIIATDVGAFREIIISYENGILVERNNAKSLANAILLLLKDKQLYSQLLRGINYFEQNHRDFDWTNIAKKYKEIMDRL